MLPKHATTNDRPTHHTIQTKTGARFNSGLRVPNRPAITIMQSRATEITRQAARNG